MPAIQTYEAQGIRPGYRAHRGDHKGTVIAIPVAAQPGLLNIEVRCETHGRNETWKNIPAHSAVHAERSL
jgi:hypothetical protein